MPTATADTRENSTVEAVKLAQDTARRYLDESASISRLYFSAWTATAQAGMRTAFDIQNAIIQASRGVLDAAAQANRTWFDQTAESVRKSQEATMKTVASGIEMWESNLPKTRA